MKNGNRKRSMPRTGPVTSTPINWFPLAPDVFYTTEHEYILSLFCSTSYYQQNSLFDGLYMHFFFSGSV
jgi:hypothetical protein